MHQPHINLSLFGFVLSDATPRTRCGAIQKHVLIVSSIHISSDFFIILEAYVSLLPIHFVKILCSHLSMLVKVAVKDKVIDIQCGDGYQPVRWLADAALARYDSNNGVDLGKCRMLFA